MSKLYHQRTNDIKKLIDTITINTNEEYNDLSHQIHLTKSCNEAAVKKISERVREFNLVSTNCC
jgi:hypothetical protein